MKKIMFFSSIVGVLTFSLGYLAAIHVYAINVEHKSTYTNRPAIITKNIEVKFKNIKLQIPKGSPILLHTMSGIDQVIQIEILLPGDADVFDLSKERALFELDDSYQTRQ